MLKTSEVQAIGRRLRTLIHEGESSTSDFKEKFPYSKDELNIFFKNICSLLNSDGGTLIFGVADTDGEIVGVNDDEVEYSKKLKKFIESLFGKWINKYIDISIVSIDNKNVCLVTCDRSPTPTFLKGKFYIRNSNMSIDLPDVTQKTFDQENQIKEVGEMSNVLLTIKNLIGYSEFRILKREISGFNSEYASNHFTSAALRVGRTLEFITYAFARSWKVEIDKTTLSCLDDIQNGFDKLSKSLIFYVSSEEDEKQKERKHVVQNSAELSARITNLVSVIDEQHEIKNTDAKININLILRNIKKKYSRNKKVRDEIDFIIKEKFINEILKLRNDAAHADTSGKEREVKQDQVDYAVQHLTSILIHLRAIAKEINNIKDSENCET